MRISFGGHKPKQPSPVQAAPALKTAGAVLVAADDEVAKNALAHDIKSLPDGAYCILFTAVPDAGGVMMNAYHYPPNRDEVVYHGLYNFAAQYFSNRTGY